MAPLFESIKPDDREVPRDRDPSGMGDIQHAEGHLVVRHEDAVEVRRQREQLLEGGLAAGRRPRPGHHRAWLDAGVVSPAR